VARVMVEIDIHVGLLECIDIDWRGKLFRQSLDYLGIPFRCTLCRKMGHLRNVCPGRIDEEQSEESMLEHTARMDSPIVNNTPTYPDLPDSGDSTTSETITGKLKSICPYSFPLTYILGIKPFRLCLSSGLSCFPSSDQLLFPFYNSFPPYFLSRIPTSQQIYNPPSLHPSTSYTKTCLHYHEILLHQFD
jgi:hypothetical protein